MTILNRTGNSCTLGRRFLTSHIANGNALCLCFADCLPVILIKAVFLDDTLDGSNISRIGGIASFLDTLNPVGMVIRSILATGLVTVCHQHLGVVFKAVKRTGKGAELVIIVVIVVITPRLSCLDPLVTGLDAEVVVVLSGKITLAVTALHGHLRQRDTGWYAVALLLFNGCRSIFLEKLSLIFAHLMSI